MKIAGIISEFNPFHNGHKYIVDRAKAEGDAVVAVMSGNFSERGEPTVVDKYTRAEMALKCGVDLVLELPFPSASSSAEYFAEAGVRVLDRVGASKIVFGSECGDISILKRAAEVARNAEFLEAYKNRELSDNKGSAEAYFELVNEFLGEDVRLSSNDMLGVEYIKAIAKNGFLIEPVTAKRLGDGFLSESVGESDFASATALRNLISDGTDGFSQYMPKEAYKVLCEAVKNGDAPVLYENIERGILLFLRIVDKKELDSIAELSGGLGNRLAEAAHKSDSLDELIKNTSTKKYTTSKIRRGILNAVLGVRNEDIRQIFYTSVLGVNETGRAILSELRKKDGEIAIVTKPADAPECRQKELSDKADALYSLSYKEAKTSDFVYKKRIYIG